jgi:MOSC domain-containing protein YiiM
MIKAIFIAKERNGIIEAPPSASLVPGKGIVGDRYFLDANRPSPDCEVSFIESENIDAYNRAHPNRIEYWQPRRNVLTQWVDLNALVGKVFHVGECAFEGIMPCEPCALFQKRTSPNALKWFLGKGGLRARILSQGMIRIGDALSYNPASPNP